VGSIQNFALENITGSFDIMRGLSLGVPTDVITDPIGAFASSTKVTTDATIDVTSGSTAEQLLTFDASTVANTATETRMVNIATKFGIRY